VNLKLTELNLQKLYERVEESRGHMNIQILQLIDGAKAARGLTVVIDVFRAFSLEAYLLAAGAERVIPVGEVDAARALKVRDPSLILAGERHGAILPGFDMGNSPSQLLGVDVTGRRVIHTTSAGTQGIASAIHADEILGGSLVNARATAAYIKKSGAKEVSLVCMGLEALAPTEEDTLCAEYIKALLENTDIDMRSGIDSLRYTSGAKFFDKAQADVFPEEDFYMCTDLDRFNFVMKLETSVNGIGYMRKVDM
jgi:2-phosphosulfolactate phosphatase